MPGIRLSPSTLRALNMIKGLIMSQEGHRLSHDEVINILMMQAKFSARDFPDWPIFKMKHWEIDKTIKDYQKRAFKPSEPSGGSRRSPASASSKPRTPRGRT